MVVSGWGVNSGIRVLMIPALRHTADVLLGLYPEPIRSAVENSLPDLMLDAARVGLEVLKAERAKISFGDAVHQPRDFPMMQRIHFGFIEMLEYEVPTSLAGPVKEMLQRAREFDDGDLGRALFAAAAYDDGTADRALLRFLIYELTRATAWALSYGDPTVEVLGCHQALDIEAESRMRARFESALMFDEDVRPLQILIAEAMEYLVEQQHERLAVVRAHGKDIMDLVGTVMAQAQAARVAAAPEAIVLRNHYAAEIGGDTLGAQELSDRHPDLFPSAEAVWQRNSRLKKAIATGSIGARRPRLIDLMRDAMGEKR